MLTPHRQERASLSALGFSALGRFQDPDDLGDGPGVGGYLLQGQF